MIRKRYHGMNLFDGFRFMFSKKPYYIVLHPTARCNCKCSFCFNWEGVKNAKEEDELKMEEINRISKNLGYVKYLTISGGEPFIRKDIAEICKIFYNNNRTKSIVIHTNCSFPERVDNAARKILESCPGLNLTICPSVDALYDRHDKLRKYNKLFNKVETTIVLLKSLQQSYKRLCILPVGVFFNETEHNTTESSNFLMWKYGLLHSRVLLRGSLAKNIKPGFTDYIAYLKRAATELKWLNNREKLNLAYEGFSNTLDVIKPKFIAQTLKTGKIALKCSAGTKTVTIPPNGNVTACEPFLNESRFLMGNLRDFNYNMNKLLNSATAQKVRDYIKKSNCACTWECIIPINMIFDRRQIFFVLKSYIAQLKAIVLCQKRLISKNVSRLLYFFYNKNKIVGIAKIHARLIKLLLKSIVKTAQVWRDEKCDILLINPPYYAWITSPVKPHNEEPLGIMSIAAFLRTKGFNVKIVDMFAEEMRLKDIIKYIRQANPKIIGIGAITRQINYAYSIGDAIKKSFPCIKIVYGGVHPSFFPKESFERGCADFVVIGEGEKTMGELCNALLKDCKDLSCIDGIAYKDDKTLKVNRPRQFIKNLDSIPPPAYDLLKGKYHTNIHIRPFNKKRTFSIMASRGCPYNCNYCSIPAIWQRKLRHRSPEHVVMEVKNAIKQYGVKNFHFYDDDFLIDGRFVCEFCNLLIKKDLNITWLCQSRTSSIVHQKDLIPLLKKAGCAVIELGIESCDEGVMRSMNKMQTADDIKASVSIIRNSRIEILPLMMSFYPGEKLDSVYNTSQLMLNLDLWSINNIEIYSRKGSFAECNGAPFIHGFFTTAIPGSDLYNNANKQGLVFAHGWNDYTFSRVNFIPYSFLEDIPVQVLMMPQDEFTKKVSAYCNTITYHLVRLPHVMCNAKSVEGYIKFLHQAYIKCDGQLSVRKICTRLSEDLKSDTISVCIALRFLAMFGLVKSRYAEY